MTVTLKEFAKFIIDFVNKNFMPHLNSHNTDHEKSIDHWRQLTELIKDI